MFNESKEQSEFYMVCNRARWVHQEVELLERLYQQDPLIINTPFGPDDDLPLNFAIKKRYFSLPLIKWLISKGADVDAVDTKGFCEGCSAFWIAASTAQGPERKDLLKALLRAGPNIDACPESGPYRGAAALFYIASGRKEWDILKMCLALGPKNVDTTCVGSGASGKTALYFAMLDGEDSVVEQLLALGASIDIPENCTGLSISTINQAKSDANLDKLANMVKILQMLKAIEDLFVHAQNKTGTREELQALLEILKTGFNAIKNKQTILKVAIDNQHFVLIELLLAKNAKRLDSDGTLLYQEGAVYLPEGCKLSENLQQTIVAVAKLDYLKCQLRPKQATAQERLEKKEDAEVVATPQHYELALKNIKLISQEIFDAALPIEEPLRSLIYYELATELSQALKLRKSLLPIIKAAIEQIHPDSGIQYKKACSLYVELSLGEAEFDLIRTPTLGLDGLEADDKDHAKKERLRRAIHAGSGVHPNLIPALALSYVLGEEHAINHGINPISIGIEDETLALSRLPDIFVRIKREIDGLRANRGLHFLQGSSSALSSMQSASCATSSSSASNTSSRDMHAK